MLRKKGFKVSKVKIVDLFFFFISKDILDHPNHINCSSIWSNKFNNLQWNKERNNLLKLVKLVKYKETGTGFAGILLHPLFILWMIHMCICFFCIFIFRMQDLLWHVVEKFPKVTIQRRQLLSITALFTWECKSIPKIKNLYNHPCTYIPQIIY